MGTNPSTAHKGRQQQRRAGMNTILVVDDEPDARRYITLVLQDNGYQVREADGVDAALEILNRERPDLVCLDIMMPKQSGYFLFRKLRGQPNLAEIPIVVVSGITDAQQFEFANLAVNSSFPEPEAYVEKPINVPAFLQTVDKLVRASHA